MASQIKNFVIGIHMPLETGGGGGVVQCHLANLLKNRGFNVVIITSWTDPPKRLPSNYIFTYDDTDKPNDIDVSSDDTAVIYCEGVYGNPLNAKNVIRWMLSELGKNIAYSNMYGWGRDEVIYYFNAEPKHFREPEKIGSIYKYLTMLYFNPNVKQTNYEPRNKECHTYRKSWYYSHVDKIHSEISTEVKFDNNHDKTISIFNEYECFYCYDPLTWLAIMAPVCGCYTIIHPVEGQDKCTWLKNSGLNAYMKENNIEHLYGVGYGLDEREYAKSTCHLAKQQWVDMQHYFNVTCLDRFIEDMSHFHDLKNRVSNNFL